MCMSCRVCSCVHVMWDVEVIQLQPVLFAGGRVECVLHSRLLAGGA